MKVLITGAGGQLGWELQRTAPAGAALLALTSQQLDITDPQAVRQRVLAESPALLINAAAYTAVDRAETEPERAFQVNAQGAANLARASRQVGARLIQLSTDFVFDGQQSVPYRPSDPPRPLGVYGQSKLAGEEEVRAICGEQGGTILRTAWVYSSHGHNFVKTMLRLLSERESLGVVSDQIGTPTWARGLAMAVWAVAALGLDGTHHWTDAGVASWYDFAVAIQEEALALGLLHRQIPIRPIPSADYPLPARRPSFAVLDKGSLWQALATTPRHWRLGLRAMLTELQSPSATAGPEPT